MLKYDKFQVTFPEVPEEICLYITLTGCPIRCSNCNSKHLWDDTGTPLSWDNLNSIIHFNAGISCVCFGGGDSDARGIDKLAAHIKKSTNLKVCWYSGQDSISTDIDIANFDYIKIGHFNGIPLNVKGTNQVMYEIEHLPRGKFELKDITYKFQNNED